MFPSLHWRLQYFSSQFFLWRSRLIWHVIANHVNCSELHALWLSGDRNCEMCHRVSHLKEGFGCTFRRITHFRVYNSNWKIKGCLRWLNTSNLEKYEYFESFSPNTTQILSKNPHTAICRQRNILTCWVKDKRNLELFKATEYVMHCNLY